MNLSRDILFQRFKISSVKQKFEKFEKMSEKKKSRHKMGKIISVLVF